MSGEAIDLQQRRRSRLALVSVCMLFVAPVAIAWLLFFVFPDWIPSATSNYGQLVEPARPLPPFALETQAGEGVDASYLQGKWTFVYLHAGACDSDCVQALYKVRQLRLAQGKDIDRLQRLMLWQADAVHEASRRELQAHFPGQVIGLLDGDPGLAAAFQPMAGQAFESGGVFLVDPAGNLMMFYARDAEPGGIIKDLHRLLKYSGLG
jgi:cytochrome oxidase Cu insertion factor (SCO1/SenC/PrrC family)